MLKLGDVEKLDLEGIKPDRRTIFPAGLAILEAIFDALELEQMVHSEGALREGVLYDLVGRHQHEDVRERTISSLMQRYHVDPEQASRVEAKALKVLAEVGDAWELNDELHRDLLSWGARVHEIGLDIAHYHYHKHGAYLIEHSDLAGFSRQDQQMLSLLVRGHRRNIPADKLAEFAAEGDKLVRLCIVLRFAILFHHIRGTQEMPSVRLKAEPKSLSVTFPEGWLEAFIERLLPCGLTAIEAYHSEHSEAASRRCLELARHYGLGVSGGSDYHGTNKPRIRLGKGYGSLRVPYSVLEDLREMRARRGLPC